MNPLRLQNDVKNAIITTSMATLSTLSYKGARDLYPDDKRTQNYIFGVWRTVSELFGYEEYGAPLLEPLEIYAAKSGQEIVNEQTYQFVDRGGRSVRRSGRGVEVRQRGRVGRIDRHLSPTDGPSVVISGNARHSLHRTSFQLTLVGTIGLGRSLAKKASYSSHVAVPKT